MVFRESVAVYTHNNETKKNTVWTEFTVYEF
jgi:hypothetical protein